VVITSAVVRYSMGGMSFLGMACRQFYNILTLRHLLDLILNVSSFKLLNTSGGFTVLSLSRLGIFRSDYTVFAEMS